MNKVYHFTDTLVLAVLYTITRISVKSRMKCCGTKEHGILRIEVSRFLRMDCKDVKGSSSFLTLDLVYCNVIVNYTIVRISCAELDRGTKWQLLIMAPFKMKYKSKNCTRTP